MIVRYSFRQTQPKSQTPKTCLGSNSYGDFLFAVAGVQDNGEPLTVNSMLAQQDLDPWEEATYLSTCPPAEGIARVHARLKASNLSWSDSQMSARTAGNLMRLLYASKSRPHASSADPNRVASKSTKKGQEMTGRRVGAGNKEVSVWRRRAHLMRLSLALVGAVTLILISLADPKAIFSNAGSGTPSLSKVSTSAIPSDRH